VATTIIRIYVDVVKPFKTTLLIGLVNVFDILKKIMTENIKLTREIRH